MNIETRKQICELLFFQDATQKGDLLDPTRTTDELLGCLKSILDAGHHVEITAVRSDHSDDTALGPHCHARGYAVDCWPLATATAGDYLDADTDAFRAFLSACIRAAHIYQIGLAGSAATQENLDLAQAIAFIDDGADHVHLGVA